MAWKQISAPEDGRGPRLPRCPPSPVLEWKRKLSLLQGPVDLWVQGGSAPLAGSIHHPSSILA